MAVYFGAAVRTPVGNSSPLNDGAAAVLVVSEIAASELGIIPMGQVDGGDDIPRCVAHRDGDRAQPVRELLIVDRQPGRADAIEFGVQRDC
jgi:hypothetical protein